MTATLDTSLDTTLAWLAGQRTAMIDALATLVDIDSSSHDPAGTTRVAHAMLGWLHADGVRAEHRAAAADGDVLAAEVSGRAPDAAPVLLMGHRDTVFPTGTVAQRPWRTDHGAGTDLAGKGPLGYGPGVADMKSGLVLQVWVLRALQRLQAQGMALPFPVRGLFTADEEIGSKHGRVAIEALGRGARAAFNAEPGRVSGNVVSARKGGATFHITVEGRAAHSGVNPQDGASAIETLARLVQALHAQTDHAQGITTNVGLISGGMSSNTVAPQASAVLDVRIRDLSQRDELFERLHALAAANPVPGTRATLTLKAEFLPLEARWSEALLARYQAAARASGFTVDGEFTGGCSDAGYTAALGIPTLCGVGPVGGRAHSEREYCELDTLVPRAQALLRTIVGLAQAD